MQIRIDGRFYSVYLCAKSIQCSFNAEIEIGTLFDLLGITFRNGKFNLQWSDFCQLGNDCGRRRIRTDTDLAKSDHSVKRST